MYQIEQLDNGLILATASMPHMASVSLGIWVGVGGRYEPAPLNGVSHFIEHMLFKGTRKRSAKEISQAVEGIGGYLNAFTSEENTCFYVKGGHDHFEELSEVLADMFLNSEFDPKEIDKERNVIKEELAMYLDQPHQRVHELLTETLWPDQPLGRSLTGTEKTLDSIGRPELVGFQKSNYVTGSTLITVAGRIQHRQVRAAVSRLLRRLPRGARPRFQPAIAKQNAPKICLHTKPTEQTQIALGIRTCSRHDPQRYTLRLLNTILGDNMSSRLFQLVREEHGLAYSIASSLSFYEDAGTLTIAAGLDTPNVKPALRLIVKELERLRESSPPLSELKRARDYLIGQLDLSLENTENHMMWLGEQLIGYGRIIPLATIKRLLHQVTPSDIRALARSYFRPDRFCLALVTPNKKSTGLQQLLANST